jgi:hypothetical protein
MELIVHGVRHGRKVNITERRGQVINFANIPWGDLMKSFFFVIALFLLVAGSLFAQSNASFNGRVTDSSGAVVPGAAVMVTNTETGVARTVNTNGDGLYNVAALTPGVYKVRVEASGFEKIERAGVRLVTDSTITLEFSLQVAGTQQSVEVTGQAPMVETTQSSETSSLQQTEVSQLPMLNRSFAAMLTTLPGTREPVTFALGAKSIGRNYVSFGGGSGDNFNMLVDGLDNHEFNDAGTALGYTLEGIEEFKLESHNFSAQYGKASGSVVVMATKSGTNNVHGSAFGYGRSDALTKIDYFSQQSGLGKPPYSREQYGGSIGGPIKKDRAFFFGAVERVSQDFNLPVPDSLFNQELLLVPLNIDVLPAHFIPQPNTDLFVQAKLNFQVSKNDSLFLRFSSQRVSLTNGRGNQSRALLTSSPFIDKDSEHMWNYALGWTRVINTTTVNQFAFQWLDYEHSTFYPPCSGPQCILEQLNFPSISTGQQANSTLTDDLNYAQFKDDFSKQLGKHTLKVGAEYMAVPKFGGNFTNGSPGRITFFDDPSTIVNNLNGKYPGGFLTPGILRSITVTSTDPGDYFVNGAWSAGFYVQDDFKPSPRLTLNVGLRYDIFPMEDQPELASNRVYQALKAIGSPFGKLPRTDTTDWQPRIGFAWDMGGNGKNVVRAGFGLFTNEPQNNFVIATLFQKPRIFFTQSIVDSVFGSGPLASFVYGVTPLPAQPCCETQLPTGQNVSGAVFDPNYKDAYSEQFNAGYSRALNTRMIASIDYVHLLGLHYGRDLDINPICTVNFQGPCGIGNYPTVAIGKRILSSATQAVYGDPNFFSNITIISSPGLSHYDEVAAHFEVRSSRVTLQANYTLSWSNAYGNAVGPTPGIGGSILPEVPNAYGGCLQCAGEWGPGWADERHRISVAGVFNLPFGVEVSPTLTAASARPYPQYRGLNTDGDGSFRCFVGSCSVGTPGVTPEVGVNAARGEPLFALSTRVGKMFRISENKNITGFAEFYNMTNRANFGNQYGSTALSPTTFNKPIGYLGGIGGTATVPDSFQVQFGARFAF